MAVTRRQFLAALTSAASTATLAACGGRQPSKDAAATTDDSGKVDKGEFKDLALDMKAWHYDADHAVWWQVGVSYCTKPQATTYEKLGIYVPGAYLKPTDDKVDLSEAESSKTFECELVPDGAAGAFTCADAPIVMPVNAAGYTAQPAPTGYVYDGLEPYLAAGLVYVYAGCRGRANGFESAASGDGFFPGGAPWAVTDLKAAVRYLRYNAGALPGDTARIVTFGEAAGGLLATLVGATGSSSLYDPYLAKIGAATHDADGADLGDDVAAVACWSPEPAPAHADVAYEWELGQFGSDSTRAEGTWTRLLSNDLAASFASQVNDLAMHDDGGNQLTVDETDGGIYAGGSYYEHLISLVEGSAAKFLSETAFPHTFTKVDMTAGDFPGSGAERLEVSATPPAAVTSIAQPTTAPAAADAVTDDATLAAVTSTDAAATVVATPDPEAATAAANAAVAAVDAVSNSKVTAPAVTYASRGDYVSALNASEHWLTFNDTKNSVRIAGLGGFVRCLRAPSLGVCAFDTTERSAATNQLFGNDDQDSLHFSSDISDLLSSKSDTYSQASGYDSKLPGDWASDLAKTDSLDKDMATRRNMYNPMYFLSGASDGFGTASVAPHWRINFGLEQPATPLATTVNLALALKAYDGVSDVALTPVWAQGRTLAEEGTADATSAFVSWVGSIWPLQ